MDIADDHHMDTPLGPAHSPSKKISTKRDRILGLHIDTTIATAPSTKTPSNKATLLEAVGLGEQIAYHALVKDIAKPAVVAAQVSPKTTVYPKSSPKLSPLSRVRSFAKAVFPRMTNSSPKKSLFRRKSSIETGPTRIIATDPVAENLVAREAVSTEDVFTETVATGVVSTEAVTTGDPKRQTVGKECIATEVVDRTVTTTKTPDTKIFSSNAVAQDSTPAEPVSRFYADSANSQLEYSTVLEETAPYHHPSKWQPDVPTAQELHSVSSDKSLPANKRKEAETEEECDEDECHDGDSLSRKLAAVIASFSAPDSEYSSSSNADDDDDDDDIDDELLPETAYNPNEPSAADDLLLPTIAYAPREGAKPRSLVAAATSSTHVSDSEVIFFTADDLLQSTISDNPNGRAELSIPRAAHTDSSQQQAYHTGEGYLEPHHRQAHHTGECYYEPHHLAPASPISRDFAELSIDPLLNPRTHNCKPSQECGASIHYAASHESRDSKAPVEAPARDPNLPLLVNIRMLHCRTDVLGLGATKREEEHEHDEVELLVPRANGQYHGHDEQNSERQYFIPLHTPSPVTSPEISPRSRFMTRETFVLPPSGAYVSSDEETYVEDMLTSGEETADEGMDDEQMEDEQMAVKRDQYKDVVAAAVDEEVIRWYRSGRYGPHMRNYLMNGEF